MKHPIHQNFPLSGRQWTAGILAALIATGPALSQAPNPGPIAPASQPAVDAALVRQLLDRIDQLERQQSAQAKATPESETRRLQARVDELEQKLRALESGGKVLPEIAITPDDAPSTTELSRKIKAIEERQTAESETAAKREAKAPVLSVGASGVRFSSADTNFTFTVKALLQTDSNLYFDDNELSEGNDGFTLRRARIYVRGTLYGNTSFEVVPQWGGLGGPGANLQDASVAYRFADHFELKAGKFKGPVGLGLLQSIAAADFSERSLVSGLVPLRNIGVQLSARFLDDAIEVAGGVFNNAGDGRNPDNIDFTDGREYAGRLFLQPFKPAGPNLLNGLGFGIGGSYSQVSSNAFGLPADLGQASPGYFTSPGTQQFFAYNPLVGPIVADGEHIRISPQGYYYFGPFGLLGEYAISRQEVYNSTTFRSASLSHSAWQVTGGWFLTGENAGFGPIEPRRPFSPRDRGWGAWQVVGRYSKFDIDDDTFPAFATPDFSATDATSWSVGLNWWLNRNLRVLASFTHTSFTGGGAPLSIANPGSLTAPSIVTAQDENLLSFRMQFSF